MGFAVACVALAGSATACLAGHSSSSTKTTTASTHTDISSPTTCGHARLIAGPGAILLVARSSCQVTTWPSQTLFPDQTFVFATVGTRVWIATRSGVEVRTRSGRIVRRVNVPAGSHDIASDSQGVWSGGSTQTLRRIDRSGATTGRESLTASQIPANAFLDDGQALWIRSPSELIRIDDVTRTRQAIQLENDDTQNGDSNAVGFGSFWIAAQQGQSPKKPAQFDPTASLIAGRGAIFRFDEHLRMAASISLPRTAGVTTGAGAVWALNYYNGTLYKIDPESNHIVGVVHLGADANTAHMQMWSAVSNHIVWITKPGIGQLIAVDPTTLRVITRIVIPHVRSGCVIDFSPHQQSNVWLELLPGC
jgi:streptogramin lyase